MSHYRLISRHDLPEYNGSGLLYRHLTTGCQVYHIRNADPENLFAFCFVTPPPNSTGVSHILEHTVLCGSHRFRLADPFLHLLKGSVQSFLNAITFPDRTIYPAASPLPKDLFNIMRVYGDAVFAPLLRKEMFEQEGHRLLVAENDELSIGGVVYNEMRGISVTQDYIEGEALIREMLPDTPYQYASGGDPAAIPDLTYKDFISFYRRHYHPSVSRIFLYGNIPTRRYLTFLHRTFLREVATSAHPIPELPTQRRWTAPRSITRTYPQSSEQARKNHSSISICWLLGEITTSFDILCAEALSALLIEGPATPLYKALIDSHLGEDISANSGAECELKELLFTVGIRGSAPEREQQFTDVVRTTLQKIVTEGIDPELIEGVMVQMDISQREIRSLQGLRLLRRAVPGWIYTGRPDSTVSAVEAITKLRVRIAQDNRFFETCIQKWLLDNPHRLTVVVKPDSEHHTREEHTYKRAMAARRAQLSAEELKVLKEREAKHTRMVEQRDRDQDIAALPHLEVRDMPSKPRLLRWHSQWLEGGIGAQPIQYVPLHSHTNGIAYWYLSWDISAVPPRLLKYLPLLCSLLTEGGLVDLSYDALARAVARVGSIGATLRYEHSVTDPTLLSVRLVVRLKALDTTLNRALELFQEILTRTDFTQSDRVEQLIRERSNEMRSSLVPAAHRFASSSAVASLARSGWIHEQWQGVSQLMFLLEERSAATIISELQKLYIGIVGSGVRESLFCGSKEHAATVRDTTLQVETHVQRRFKESAPASTDEGRDLETPHSPRNTSFIIPTGGNYAAFALPATPFSVDTTERYVSETVLCRLLSTSVLWEQIRMKGGAYGAGASHTNSEGVVCLFSYRDPRVRETYDAFRSILADAAAHPFPQSEIDRVIVTMSGKECEPLTPAEESSAILGRILSGLDNPLRAALHTILLKCKSTHVQAAAARLSDAVEHAALSVVGEESTIHEATKSWPQLGERVAQLPL